MTACGGQRPSVQIAPAIDAAEHRAFGDAAASSHSRRASTGRPTSSTTASLIGFGGLGAAELDFCAGQFGAVGLLRIDRYRILVDQLLDAQGGHLAAATAAGRKGREQKRAVANVDQAIAAAGLEQGGQNVGGHRLFALAGRGAGRWPAPPA